MEGPILYVSDCCTRVVAGADDVSLLAIQNTSSRLAVRSPEAATRRPSARSHPVGSHGPIQSLGLEHRGPVRDILGEDVRPPRCPAHRVLGAVAPVKCLRVTVIDRDLEHGWFGLEHRGQAADEMVAREKPPVVVQMEPESSADLGADRRE